MGLWSAYFAIKLLLYAQGVIDFHPWANLAFAAFTTLEPADTRQRLAKNLIALPVGVLLLYDDSFLPSLSVLVAHASLHTRLAGALDWRLPVEVALVLGLYELARRKLRVATFVFVGIFAVVLLPRGLSVAQSVGAGLDGQPPPPSARRQETAPDFSAAALDTRLAAFYAQQAEARLEFPRMPPDAVPYDIIILQVAALAWSDLQALGLEHDPLFDRFDILFTHFNSAATDAQTAARRFARGNCGQTDEQQLLSPAPRECQTFAALESAGFEPQILTRAAAGDPLSQWLERRGRDPAARVVGYAQIDTLAAGPSSAAAAVYAARFGRLSGDIRRFLDGLQTSGRHAIVILIGEHGAALAGDHRQPSGLREIPTPSLTEVPAAVAFVNAAHGMSWAPQRVTAPTSYLGLATLLSRCLANDPFDTQDLNPRDYARELPETQFVAAHGGATVLQVAQRLMLRSSEGRWETL
jgi:hypothetical protein